MAADHPLASITVLDLTRMYPGAFCSLLLADLGADVIKVEAPGAGDGLRGMAPPGSFNATHTALNRGKRSVGIDVRNADAAPVLRRLVRSADILLESNRPGQLDDLGIGFADLREQNPSLVWCSITGFGTTGPNASAPGHDLTFLGYAGLLDRLAESSPTPPGTTIAIPLAATMAVAGVLAAVVDASRTGVGRQVEVDMTDSAMWVLAEDVARAANAPAPGWGPLAGRHVYTCADGRQVTVASTEPRTWAALCEALDVPDLAGHRLGADPEGPVIARLVEVFGTRSAAEWLARPGLAGGVGPVHAVEDLLEDPQVTERRSLTALDGSDARVLANPIRLDGADGAAASAGLSEPPALGRDTDAVLAHAGYAPDEIAALRSAGIVS